MSHKIYLSQNAFDDQKCVLVVDDLFFKNIPQNLIEKGTVNVFVDVHQQPNKVDVVIDLDGHIELTCDRSLQPFMYPIQKKAFLMFKFSDHFEELSDDVYLIEKGIMEIDLTNHIFDLIALEIPMKKIHPEFKKEAEMNDTDTNEVLVYTTHSAAEPVDTPIDVADPRWEILKKLKDTF